MRITGPRSTRSSPAGSKERAGGVSGAKFSIPEGPKETAATWSSAPVGQIATLSGILAAQEVDEDGRRGQREQVERAEDLLGELEQLRHDMLLGRVPERRLLALQERLKNRAGAAADPRLAVIVGEIEIRVAVELAKLGY